MSFIGDFLREVEDIEDPEQRAAVERIVANWPIQFPDPKLDGATTINAITGEEVEPGYHTGDTEE